MANTNAAAGFKPLRHLGGGVIREQEFLIASSGTTGYNDNLRRGDLVKLNADGTIEAFVNNDGVSCGVFNGCQYIATDGSITFSPKWVASTAILSGSVIKASVYADPMITYEVQADTATQALVGAVCDVVVGTGTTNQSDSYVDSTDVTTGVARVLGIIDRPDNAAGAYAKLEVLLNSQFNVVTTI